MNSRKRGTSRPKSGGNWNSAGPRRSPSTAAVSAKKPAVSSALLRRRAKCVIRCGALRAKRNCAGVCSTQRLRASRAAASHETCNLSQPSQALGIISEHLRTRQLGRVKGPEPFLVAEAGSADPDLRASMIDLFRASPIETSRGPDGQEMLAHRRSSSVDCLCNFRRTLILPVACARYGLPSALSVSNIKKISARFQKGFHSLENLILIMQSMPKNLA